MPNRFSTILLGRRYDPGFVDAAQGNYRLRPDATVFKHLPTFNAIPFEQMGLKRLH